MLFYISLFQTHFLTMYYMHARLIIPQFRKQMSMQYLQILSQNVRRTVNVHGRFGDNLKICFTKGIDNINVFQSQMYTAISIKPFKESYSSSNKCTFPREGKYFLATCMN